MKTKNLLVAFVTLSGLMLAEFGFCLANANNSNNLIHKSEFLNINLEDSENCGTAAYREENGLVVIEAENLEISGTNWNIKTDFSNYTGNGYLSWDGNNNYGTPGNGLITTEIYINTPGTYRFQWRSRIGSGNNSTEHNDSWLRFPDASDFYAEKNGNRIYPKGSGQTPNPNGAGADGWFKVYLSGSTNWTWSTRTSDNDAHNIFVEFDSAGIYTMEISGRSQFHLIDRITLSNNATDPLDLGNEETICTGGALNLNSFSANSEILELSVFPNPAETFMTISIKREVWSRKVSIYDFKGTFVRETNLNNNNKIIDVSELSSGFYILRTDDNLSKTFIKK